MKERNKKYMLQKKDEQERRKENVETGMKERTTNKK